MLLVSKSINKFDPSLKGKLLPKITNLNYVNFDNNTLHCKIEFMIKNAADRTAEQYAFENRVFTSMLDSLGLNVDFSVSDTSIFKNIGEKVISNLQLKNY